MTALVSLRIRIFSTILGIALGIAAASTLIGVYESLEYELSQWTSGANADVIQVILLTKGTYIDVADAREKMLEGLALFRDPDSGASESQSASFNETPQFFTVEDVAYIQKLPSVKIAAWERPYLDPFVTEQGATYRLYQVPHEYFEMAGLSLAEGSIPSSGDATNLIILGSEAKRKIFGDTPAVGKELIPTLWGWNEPMVVSGVLEPAGPAYQFMADFMNGKIYIPATISFDGKVDNTLNHETGVITSLWIQPRIWKREDAIRQINDYLTAQYGDTSDVQITGVRENALYLGGIAMREFLLLRFVWVIAITEFAAALNIVISVRSLLEQRRYEIGVRRCLGSSRKDLIFEYLRRSTVYGIASAVIGLAIAFPLSMQFGNALQFCTSGCEAVPLQFGWLTILVGTGMGVALWWLGTFAALSTILKNSPADLLREADSDSFKIKGIIGWLGFAVSISALLITLGIRDGTLAQFERILAWSGGRHTGTFVSWTTHDTKPGGMAVMITRDHYWLLKDKFPDFQIGWLNTKGGNSEITILDASANLSVLRPPMLKTGRWFTPQEEKNQSQVVVLGPQLADQLAEERSITPEHLIGQEWHSYAIIGIMDQWPALYSMGYYPDAAYVPVGISGAPSTESSPRGQIPFVIPEGFDNPAMVDEMGLALQTLGVSSGTNASKKYPQVILSENIIGEALSWRMRLAGMLAFFAGLSLFIGSAGVMNQTFIWVVSRWREIGIRRAIGAEKGAIILMILTKTLIATLMAAVIGMAAGIPVALVVQSRSGWPLTLYPGWLGIVMGISFVSAMIFGMFPALWAVSRPPTEILRVE